MTGRLREAVAALVLVAGAGCTSPGAEPGDHRLALPLPSGATVVYLLHAPPGIARHGRRPLVIALHGVPGSPGQMARTTDLSRLADRHGFLVAYPESLTDPADVGRLVDHLVAHWRVDPHRVHVTGFSVGGAVTYTLATELSDRVASFAVVSGPTTGDLDTDPPTSLLAIEGVRDDLMPTFHRADAEWARSAACGTPDVTRVRLGRTPAVRSTARCRAGTDHTVYRVARTGHAWPPGASDVVWDFFRAHPLR
ncbi:alpha/beta hydrolase family esterase [Nocardioides panacisoli]|uniref:PHB depolymerase family esterase n=1 Tax=Nocardioides panacisoli TaxID=627624 RepID=A0ABP7ILE0_9ACTN